MRQQLIPSDLYLVPAASSGFTAGFAAASVVTAAIEEDGSTGSATDATALPSSIPSILISLSRVPSEFISKISFSLFIFDQPTVPRPARKMASKFFVLSLALRQISAVAPAKFLEVVRIFRA